MRAEPSYIYGCMNLRRHASSSCQAPSRGRATIPEAMVHEYENIMRIHLPLRTWMNDGTPQAKSEPTFEMPCQTTSGVGTIGGEDGFNTPMTNPLMGYRVGMQMVSTETSKSSSAERGTYRTEIHKRPQSVEHGKSVGTHNHSLHVYAAPHCERRRQNTSYYGRKLGGPTYLAPFPNTTPAGESCV